VRLFLLFIAVAGIFIEIVTTKDVASISEMFFYFTIQTNLIVALCMIFVLIASKQDKMKRFLAYFESGTCVWILITGILYGILLSGFYRPEGWKMVSNLLLHYITPSTMVLYYLFLAEKLTWRPSILLVWMGYPVGYAVFSLVRGSMTGGYPYWFLNPTDSYPAGAGSLLNVFLLIGLFVLFFEGVGTLLFYIKSKITK
jgi:hypothetical protein